MSSLILDNWLYAVALFVVFVLGCLTTIEIGYRFGQKRRAKAPDIEKAEPRGAAVTSTLALLAFILAFTFGMAGSRYEDRKIAVLEEANAIGTAYLRSELVPVTHQETVRALLREYINIRLKGVLESDYIQHTIARSKEIHNELWAETVTIANQYPPSVNHSLFVQSINDMIDLHEKRMAVGIYNRIPGVIWVALFFVSFLAMGSMGIQAGLAGSKRTMTAVSLALSFSTVLTVIAVLDYPPQQTMRIVNQQVMIDLQKQINKNSP